METQTDAQQALDQISSTNRSVADRLITPLWYHPLLGLLVGGLVAGYALGSTWVRLITLIVYVAGLVALRQAYQRTTGVWISGFRAGRARVWAIALAVVAWIGLGAALMLARTADPLVPVLVIATSLFAATIVLGWRFDVAVRQQLRSRT